MSDYEQKPNYGSLFAVKVKKTPNSPDYRGDIVIDLKDFKVVNNKVTVALGGWKKVGAKSNKTYLSLKASPPYEQNEHQPIQSQEVEDEEDPF